jgi:quinol monooxygenase YgiN
MVEQLIVTGWVDYGSERDRVLPAFLDVARASLDEPGCHAYSPAPDPQDAGRILVFERWQSKSDLAAHLTAAHVDVFREAIAPYPRLDSSLWIHYVDHSEEFGSADLTSG